MKVETKEFESITECTNCFHRIHTGVMIQFNQLRIVLCDNCAIDISFKLQELV